MITHRLDILSRVDKIFFMKSDGDFAVGEYRDLIKKDQEFKNMIFNKQD